jgi:biotin carboxyl carrier protein
VKLSVEVDGDSCVLDLQRRNGGEARYLLRGAIETSGAASVAEVMPGVFSVLLGNRSFEVRLEQASDSFEVWTGSERHAVLLSDVRDRPARGKRAGAAGPVELRAQMPGKVINLLVQLGAAVRAGQGLMVVEAMKMQNEMKSPKDGIISKIHAAEGATVAAGEALLVVE